MTEYEIKVYKIWYSDAPNDIYVGSTKRTIAQRMGDHRLMANKGTSLIYRTMIEKGVNNFEYCMLGSCMVSNKDEQRMFEQSYIDRLKPILNMYRAYSTEDDYKQKKKEYKQKPEVKQKKKEYEQTLEAKQKAKDRRQTPEYKQKKKERQQTPEAKQKAKDRNQTPEYKQKQKEYKQTNEAKQKRRERDRIRSLNPQ